MSTSKVETSPREVTIRFSHPAVEVDRFPASGRTTFEDMVDQAILEFLSAKSQHVPFDDGIFGKAQNPAHGFIASNGVHVEVTAPLLLHTELFLPKHSDDEAVESLLAGAPEEEHAEILALIAAEISEGQNGTPKPNPRKTA